MPPHHRLLTLIQFSCKSRFLASTNATETAFPVFCAIWFCISEYSVVSNMASCFFTIVCLHNLGVTRLCEIFAGLGALHAAGNNSTVHSTSNIAASLESSTTTLEYLFIVLKRHQLRMNGQQRSGPAQMCLPAIVPQSSLVRSRWRLPRGVKRQKWS